MPPWQWTVEGDSKMATGKSEGVSDVRALRRKTWLTTCCVCQMHTVHCCVKWVPGRFTYCLVCVRVSCVCVCVSACMRTPNKYKCTGREIFANLGCCAA